jgi:hypothetical protein
MKGKRILAALLALATAVAPAAAAENRAMGRATVHGPAEVNGTPVGAETTLFAGDRLRTGADAAVSLALPGRDQVFLPERTTVRVSEAGRPRITLESGAAAVVSRADLPVEIVVRGVRIAAPAGAAYEVAAGGNRLEVLARRGVVTVTSPGEVLEVPEGSRLEADFAPAEPGAPVDAISRFERAILVTAISLGIAGFVVGMAAFLRDRPQDCSVTGSATPFTITCP